MPSGGGQGPRAFALRVRTRADAMGAARVALNLALSVGLGAAEAGRVGIIASELASNLVKHADGGGLIVREEPLASGRPGLTIIAHDAGPRIEDLGVAFADGCGGEGPIEPAQLLGRRGLGTGLGAVLRLSDALEFHQGRRGKAFVARVFVAAESGRQAAAAGRQRDRER